MGYTLTRLNAYRNAQPTSHETFLLPSSGELENRFDRVLTSVFQRARFSWYFSFRGQFFHSRFVLVVACRRGVIFWRFAGQRAAQKLRLFCRLPPLETADTTRKRQDGKEWVSGKLRPRKHRPQTSDLENSDPPNLENSDLENSDPPNLENSDP